MIQGPGHGPIVPHGGKRGRHGVCVHDPPSLHGWLAQASLEDRGDERFLLTGINRAGRLSSGLFGTPRGQPSLTLSRIGGRNLFNQEVKGVVWGEGAGSHGLAHRPGVHMLSRRPHICIIPILLGV